MQSLKICFFSSSIDLFDRPFLDPHTPWGLIALCKHSISENAILPVIERRYLKNNCITLNLCTWVRYFLTLVSIPMCLIFC